MANEFLADNLIEAARVEGLLPQSDEESTSERLRAIFNREQRLYLMTLLLKAREEYQTDSATITLVAGTTRYALPSRAAGAAISRVLDAAGNPLTNTKQSTLHTLGGVGYGYASYYLDGNYLVLLSAPASASTLTVKYPRRFNKLVEQDSAGQISDISGNVITVVLPSDESSNAPDTFVDGTAYDFIRGTPHFDILGKDETADITGNVLTFDEDVPDEIAVGDFVALAGQTPVCNAPLELQDVLVLKVCHSYLSSGGDAQRTAMVEKRLAQAEADALTLISPRVKEENAKLINYSGPGWNRGSLRWRRGQ